MNFTILSIIIISIFGTLSHFLYDYSGHNKIIGLFTAVNESTWEHIKIGLTPTLMWGFIDGYIFGSNANYFLAKLLSLITIIYLIPILFYGYKYIFKKENFVIDIIIFYVTIICSNLLFSYLIKINPIPFFYQYISCISIFILFGCYMTLTLMPIKNFVFIDPVSKKFGYKGHKH